LSTQSISKHIKGEMWMKTIKQLSV